MIFVLLHNSVSLTCVTAAVVTDVTKLVRRMQVEVQTWTVMLNATCHHVAFKSIEVCVSGGALVAGETAPKADIYC